MTVANMSKFVEEHTNKGRGEPPAIVAQELKQSVEAMASQLTTALGHAIGHEVDHRGPSGGARS